MSRAFTNLHIAEFAPAVSTCKTYSCHAGSKAVLGSLPRGRVTGRQDGTPARVVQTSGELETRTTMMTTGRTRMTLRMTITWTAIRRRRSQGQRRPLRRNGSPRTMVSGHVSIWSARPVFCTCEHDCLFQSTES